jgi:type IV pilus assembly protein PilC
MTITPTWQYSGRELDGGRVKGRIDAPSEAAVVGRLRSMGVVPTSVKQVGTGTGLNRDIEIGFLDKGVGLKDLAIMARQFATMVSAGISLLQALTILSEQTENKKLAVVLGTVRTDVETGASLSYALQRHAKVFPPLLISLVRAGETGGFLERALQAVAVNYEKEVKLRNAIKSAMTYPVIVLVIAILAIIGMIIFIVPVFQKMFADLGGELPLPTQILVGLSQNMIWIGPLVAIIAVGGAIWWRSHKHDARVREFIDPLRLKLPVFGTLTKKIAIARFTRNFSTMIGAGVPILQALAIVGETSNNSVL